MNGRRRKTKNGAVNLYWVTTDDHDDDWFILAATAQAAKRYHTEYEGYSPGDAHDAHAELILGAVPGHISGSMPGHAQLRWIFEKLGFEILKLDPHGLS